MNLRPLQENCPLWVRALLDTDLTSTECRVAMYLVWRQGGNAYAWPSRETMAADLDMTTEGVRKIIRRLQSKGRITIARPKHTAPGRGLRYHVNTPTVIRVNDNKHPNSGLREHPNECPESPQRRLGVTPKEHNIEHKSRTRIPRTASKSHRFTPPTAEQVTGYAEAQGNPIFNAQRFVDHYAKLDWHDVKGKPVKDWKARVRTWIARDNQHRIDRGQPPLDGYSQYGTHPATEEEIQVLEEAGVI